MKKEWRRKKEKPVSWMQEFINRRIKAKEKIMKFITEKHP